MRGIVHRPHHLNRERNEKEDGGNKYPCYGATERGATARALDGQDAQGQAGKSDWRAQHRQGDAPRVYVNKNLVPRRLEPPLGFGLEESRQERTEAAEYTGQTHKQSGAAQEGISRADLVALIDFAHRLFHYLFHGAVPPNRLENYTV